ncbi:hypothetical protein [Nocardia cyriacigeorgica]|uniref:hypothetical protein n=1 Tax=Nocardia cyriacigeorgica TaxID=135487 RepID=UPI001BB27DB8|nr:hypothetical protein [Nocardia cyriacigeorgica]
MYELDRIDRALDELVRNPQKASASAPAAHIRSALGHASQAIGRRREIAPEVELDSGAEFGAEDQNFRLVDIRLWIQSEPTITVRDREILNNLAAGESAESLANRDGLPVTLVRQRISRARRHARQIWQSSAVVA